MSLDLKNIRLVTFDVFGTLVDWRGAVEAVFPGKYQRFCQVSEQLQREGGFTNHAALLKAVAHELNPGLDTRIVTEFADNFGASSQFSDVRALHDLKFLTRIGCVSNSDTHHQMDVQKATGLPWDVMVTWDHMQAWKPSESAWQMAERLILDQTGIEKSQWLHVSAFPSYDLRPCRERGIQTCFIPRPGGGSAVDAEAVGPDMIVSDLFELARQFQAAKDGPWRYRVKAISCDLETHLRFMDWMRHEHGNDLLKITGCSEFRVFETAPQEAHCEYIFSTRTALDRYLNGAAAQLRAKGREIFDESEVVFSRDESRLHFHGLARKRRDFS